MSAYNRKDSNKALPGFRTYEQNYFDKQQIPLSNFIESNYIIPYNSLNFNATNEFIKNIPENINRGIIKNNERYLNRKNIETPDSKIVIGTDWNGAKRNWMITAFKQNKSASKRLMNDAPLSNITFGNGTRSIPKLVAPSYIIPQNEPNFNATNEFIKKLLEFDTEDLKQNNSDSSKKFIQMLLKQDKE